MAARRLVQVDYKRLLLTPEVYPIIACLGIAAGWVRSRGEREGEGRRCDELRVCDGWRRVPHSCCPRPSHARTFSARGGGSSRGAQRLWEAAVAVNEPTGRVPPFSCVRTHNTRHGRHATPRHAHLANPSLPPRPIAQMTFMSGRCVDAAAAAGERWGLANGAATSSAARATPLTTTSHCHQSCPTTAATAAVHTCTRTTIQHTLTHTNTHGRGGCTLHTPLACSYTLHNHRATTHVHAHHPPPNHKPQPAPKHNAATC